MKNIESVDDNQNDANTKRNKKRVFFTKRRGCILCSASQKEEISYKNPNLIQKFVSEGGRILPKRVTNICALHQKKIKKAIKIARILLFYQIL